MEVLYNVKVHPAECQVSASVVAPLAISPAQCYICEDG